MAGQAGFQDSASNLYVAKLASALSDFNNSLASSRSGSLAQAGSLGLGLARPEGDVGAPAGHVHRLSCILRHPVLPPPQAAARCDAAPLLRPPLAQIWLPEPGEDGGVVLNTQGLPYSINGVGDLLALFRCISCKYKFSTDVAKAQQMGAGGCRVRCTGRTGCHGAANADCLPCSDAVCLSPVGRWR